jgi:ubiquinone/menaquinone biosynthesis C-methylase UbiE
VETAEGQRISSEYARRDSQVQRDSEAWAFMHDGAARKAAEMLRSAGVFPARHAPCLEIGFGHQGWLPHLIRWGVPERNIHGIELCAPRVSAARELLPVADLRTGDASHLPWEDNSFHIVVVSTVFTSILDTKVRAIVAREVTRVLAPGGALIWYDFKVNNPSNPNVRRVDRGELRKLYPSLHGEIRSITLAPPLVRLILPVSYVLANLVEAVPWLRTHLIAVLVKPI